LIAVDFSWRLQYTRISRVKIKVNMEALKYSSNQKRGGGQLKSQLNILYWAISQFHLLPEIRPQNFHLERFIFIILVSFPRFSLTPFIVSSFYLFFALFRDFDLLFYFFCFQFRKMFSCSVWFSVVCPRRRVYYCVNTSTKGKIQLYTSNSQKVCSGKGWASQVTWQRLTHTHTHTHTHTQSTASKKTSISNSHSS
jgi:hypothetical protein